MHHSLTRPRLVTALAIARSMCDSITRGGRISDKVGGDSAYRSDSPSTTKSALPDATSAMFFWFTPRRIRFHEPLAHGRVVVADVARRARRDGPRGESTPHEPRRQRHVRQLERGALDERAVHEVREDESHAAVEVLLQPRLVADAPVHREHDVHAVHQRAAS